MVVEDVDIRDPIHLDWTKNARYNPSRDKVIIVNIFARNAMDPSIKMDDGMKMGSKVIIDATRCVPEEELSLPPKDTMESTLGS